MSKQPVLWVVEESHGKHWRRDMDRIYETKREAKADARFWENYYAGNIKFRVVAYVRRDEK